MVFQREKQERYNCKVLEVLQKFIKQCPYDLLYWMYV